MDIDEILRQRRIQLGISEEAYTNTLNKISGNEQANTTGLLDEISSDVLRNQISQLSGKPITEPEPQRTYFGSVINDIGTAVRDTAQNIGSRWAEGADRLSQIQSERRSGQRSLASYLLRTAGNTARTVSGTVGDIVLGAGEGAVRTILPDSVETPVFEGIQSALGGVANTAQNVLSSYQTLKQENPQVAQAINTLFAGVPEIANTGEEILGQYQTLQQTNPELAQDIADILDIGLLGVDVATAGVGRQVAGEAVEQAGRAVARQGDNIASQIRNTLVREAPEVAGEAVEQAGSSLGRTAEGVQQIISEFAGRVRRRVADAPQSIESAAERSRRIQESTPAVGRAIELQVGDDLINLIENADKDTAQIVKQGLDVKSNPSSGTKNVLEPVGDEAVKMFNLVEDQRKKVGKQIENEIAKLSSERTIDAQSVYNKLDENLRKIGVTQSYDERNPLNFATQQFSDNERNAITKLYKEVTRLGDKISPKDIYQTDNLISKLNRESRVIEGLSDILVTVDGETKNIYQLFREIFSNELDEILPEVRGINREYRKYRVLQDDLEDTLFRDTQLLESIRGDVSKASFVPNAIRRAFSDATTAPNYAEILRKLQTEARNLGYTGADIERAGNILLRLQRDYFPNTRQIAGLRSQVGAPDIPTSVTGVAGNLINRVANLGRNTIEDYQKAIRDLIEERIQ